MIRLDLVKHLMIKISETSFTQRFDDSMSSFSSEKENIFGNLIYTVRGDNDNNNNNINDNNNDDDDNDNKTHN